VLDQLLVVELASVLAGPSVGQFLAEHGARVIKIENPRTGGDVTRSWHQSVEDPEETATYFSACNFGKESVALDIRDPDCMAALKRLIARADVVTSSFAPGSADRLGLGDARIRAWNPRVVHAAVTGYGPDVKRAGYDAVIQAESGFMSINGHADGPATKMPVALIDVLAAHHLKEAILVALLNRTATGLGDYVQVSLLDAAISSLANQATGWLGTGSPPSRTGSLHPNIAPYGVILKTGDGKQVLLAVGTDSQFERLCDVLRLPGMAHDARFADNASRVRHRDLLQEVLGAEAAGWSGPELLAGLNARAIPAGEIRSVPEVLSTAPAHRLILPGAEGRPGLRQRVSRSSGESPTLSSPPVLGAHTQAVLLEFSDMDLSHIDHLRNAGSILVA
jgi:crotonobetainyl-CoA:carnitine CoA-transferase CaiB-like acyl-CoA transferase